MIASIRNISQKGDPGGPWGTLRDPAGPCFESANIISARTCMKTNGVAMGMGKGVVGVSEWRPFRTRTRRPRQRHPAVVSNTARILEGGTHTHNTHKS